MAEYELVDDPFDDLFDDEDLLAEEEESDLISMSDKQKAPYQNQPGESPIKVLNAADIKARLLAVETAAQKKREAISELDQALKEARSVLSAYKGFAIQLDDETIIQIHPNGYGGNGLYTKLRVVKL